MSGSPFISNTSMLIASTLVLFALTLSYSLKLGTGKDTIISATRAVIQLIIAGYLLEYVFGMESPLFTSLLLAFMVINAANNSSKRGKGIRSIWAITSFAIATGTIMTLSVLLFANIINYEPYQVIPISGMIISNSMVALGLSYRQMISDFRNKRDEIEARLSLGAEILPSSLGIIRDAIRTGIVPTIDSAKTLGVVSLPGMMTGLILAGVAPMEAIKYQIIVTFMLLSTTSISTVVACYLAYRGFFNERKQLLVLG